MRCCYCAEKEALDRRLIGDRPGFLKATRAPYLLSRDEISPKRDRPCFEGSQEAISKPKGTRTLAGRRCKIVKSQTPLLAVSLPSFCPPVLRWMTDDRRARPIFRLNSCEPSSPRNSTGRGAREQIFNLRNCPAEAERGPPFPDLCTADTIA